MLIFSAEIEDRGTYTCIVQNAAGETKKDFALEVLIPPTISLLARDKRLALIENATLTLDCPASGSPHPTIQWLKDGRNLTSENIGSIIENAKLIGTTIQIDGIKQSSGIGQYTCQASNPAGNDDATVTVDVMSKKI